MFQIDANSETRQMGLSFSTTLKIPNFSTFLTFFDFFSKKGVRGESRTLYKNLQAVGQELKKISMWVIMRFLAFWTFFRLFFSRFFPKKFFTLLFCSQFTNSGSVHCCAARETSETLLLHLGAEKFWCFSENPFETGNCLQWGYIERKFIFLSTSLFCKNLKRRFHSSYGCQKVKYTPKQL